VKLTDAEPKYGAVGPVKVTDWPVGAAESATRVIVSLFVKATEFVATIERAPGAAAPELQV
jgi:hypothetical protein